MTITPSVPPPPSSSSSSSSSSFSITAPPPPSTPWVPFTLTQNEINAFHNIDRTLYSRLVINLQRNPVGSMHVMALWIWFERVGHHKGNLVNQMLGFSDEAISALADEAVMCLMCVEREYYPPESDLQKLSLTQSLTGISLSLRFFHENRGTIVPALMKVMDEVCLKAFQDILQEAMLLQSTNPSINHSNQFANFVPSTKYRAPNPTQSGSSRNPRENPHPLAATPKPPQNSPVAKLSSPLTHFTNSTLPPSPGGSASSSSGNVTRVSTLSIVKEGRSSDLTRPSDQLEVHDDLLKIDMMEMLTSMHIEVPGATEGYDAGKLTDEVPPADRTMFLTSWRGYPLLENEIRDFFTRKYGDCLEAIYMQATASGKKSVYACLVIRSASTIDVILDRKGERHFSINGKHVLAQRYVWEEGRPLTPPSPSPSPSPSQSKPPPSPTSLPPVTGIAPGSYPPIQFGSLKSL